MDGWDCRDCLDMLWVHLTSDTVMFLYQSVGLSPLKWSILTWECMEPAPSAHLANWSFCHVVTHFSTTEVVSLLNPGTSLWGLESGLNSFCRVITILLNDKKHLSVNVFWPLCPQTAAFMASIGVFLNKAYGFLFLEKVLCYITWHYSIPWPVMHYSIWS